MTETPDGMDVSKRIVWQDNRTGAHGAHIEETTVAGNETEAIIQGFTSLVPPAQLTSAERTVAAWELAKMVARENLAAKERQIPEASRRRVARDQARKKAELLNHPTDVCPWCGNTGWIEDPVEGTGAECPYCDSSQAFE